MKAVGVVVDQVDCQVEVCLFRRVVCVIEETVQERAWLIAWDRRRSRRAKNLVARSAAHVTTEY